MGAIVVFVTHSTNKAIPKTLHESVRSEKEKKMSVSLACCFFFPLISRPFFFSINLFLLSLLHYDSPHTLFLFQPQMFAMCCCCVREFLKTRTEINMINFSLLEKTNQSRKELNLLSRQKIIRNKISIFPSSFYNKKKRASAEI